jgi:hypothetical protein
VRVTAWASGHSLNGCLTWMPNDAPNLPGWPVGVPYPQDVPQFEVRLMEWTRSTEAPVAPSAPTPGGRILVCSREAPGPDAAVEYAWQTWDAKYGPGQRPAGHTIEVKQRR